MGTQLPETCRENNKYIKKYCAPIWFYLQGFCLLILLITVYEYLKWMHNLFCLVDGSTSPGSKMQIEMDTTSSHSSLSFGTYSYQYTRGIDVQQVTIIPSYKLKIYFHETYFCMCSTNSLYEDSFYVLDEAFSLGFVVKVSWFSLHICKCNVNSQCLCLFLANKHSINYIILFLLLVIVPLASAALPDIVRYQCITYKNKLQFIKSVQPIYR